MNKFAQTKLRWQKEEGYIAPGANEQELLTEQEVNSIENALECRLPSDFREFFKIFGGCFSCPSLEFDYEKNGMTTSDGISGFFHFFRDKTVKGYARIKDIVAFNLDFRPEKAPETICIGYDPGGFMTCLCVHGEHFGSVYFWDRDKAWSAESVDDLYFVASSFEEFVNTLRVAH